jgi:hypothetical protein
MRSGEDHLTRHYRDKESSDSSPASPRTNIHAELSPSGSFVPKHSGPLPVLQTCRPHGATTGAQFQVGTAKLPLEHPLVPTGLAGADGGGCPKRSGKGTCFRQLQSGHFGQERVRWNV